MEIHRPEMEPNHMTDTITTVLGTEARPAFLDGFARMHAAMRRDAARP
jgi:hypothetical protein